MLQLHAALASANNTFDCMTDTATLFRLLMLHLGVSCCEASMVWSGVQVVAERWGSLNSLTAGLTEQKAAHGELPFG